MLPIYLLIPALILLPIAPQPVGCYGCVTAQQNQITLFSAPLEYNTIGLLAHDYLSGEWFYEIEPGDSLVLMYPGKSHSYRVTDTYSVFPSRRQEGAVYNLYYRNGGLTLQTCNGSGFLFIRAVLVSVGSMGGKE